MAKWDHDDLLDCGTKALKERQTKALHEKMAEQTRRVMFTGDWSRRISDMAGAVAFDHSHAHTHTHFTDASGYAMALAGYNTESGCSLLSSNSLLRMIGMRLHTGEGQRLPFDFIMPFKLKGDEVVVFVVQDNKPCELRDSWTLFPSDGLITQLRLLEKK